ncbi:TRAP transporter large permease [Robertmurraya massiliosenegalensis]|uniref:TRAP transporter large permease n=1 Tax=Robertmurraya TaxID=2837507 RepID=UPI0039A4D414
MMSLLTVALLIVLVVIRTPISMTLGISALITFWVGGFPLRIIPQALTGAVFNFTLLAVPFFILAGNLMNTAGLTERIFNFARALVGRIAGGLAHVNVVASTLFAGISGSAVADIAGLGVIEYKAMKEAGYRNAFSAAITAVSGCIGPIMPPSIFMIIYAVIAEVSVAKLFIAGIVPAILMTLVLMITIYIQVKSGREICPVDPPAPLSYKWKTFKAALLTLGTPIIVLYGMVGGLVTPTQAGILAVVYTIIIGFIYRELTWSKMVEVFKESALLTSHVIFLVAIAGMLGWIVTYERVGETLTNFFLSLTDSHFLVLLIILVILLFAGTIMSGTEALIILAPILVPVITNYGIDPVHFGVVMCVALAIGVVTPPIGIGLFVISNISKIKIEQIVPATIPYIIALIICLLIVTFIPGLSTWLPDQLVKD